MFALFLLGLLSAMAIIVVVAVLVMSIKWLSNKIREKLKNKEKHKVAFADTREVVDEYLKNKADNAEGISMDDLERMCAETPFVAADIDQNGNISEFEGFKADNVEDNFKYKMKEQKGMIIVGA